MSGRSLRLLVWMVVLSLVLTAAVPVTQAAVSVQPLTLEQAVTLLQQRGVVQPGAMPTLRLGDPVTRAEMVKVVVAAMGQSEAAAALAGSATFPDTRDHWASGYIAMAYITGLVRGRSDGRFHPDAPMTGPEALTLLLRMLGREGEAQGPWPAGVVEAATRLGIVPPDLSAAVWQNQPITRGDAFTVLAVALTRVPVTPDGRTLAEVVDARRQAGQEPAPGLPGTVPGGGTGAWGPGAVPAGEPAQVAVIPGRARAVAGGWVEVPIALRVLNAAGGPAAGGPFAIALQATGSEVARLDRTEVQVAAGEEGVVRLTAVPGGPAGLVTIQARLRNREEVRGYGAVTFEPRALAAVRLEALPDVIPAGGPGVPLRAVALDQDGQPFPAPESLTVFLESSDPGVVAVLGGPLTIPAGRWESSGTATVRPVAPVGAAEVRGRLSGGGAGVPVLAAPVRIGQPGPVAGLRITAWNAGAPADGVTPVILRVERVDAAGQPVAGDTTPVVVTSLRGDVEVEPLGEQGGVAFFAARTAVPGEVTFAALARDRIDLTPGDTTVAFRAGVTTRVVLRVEPAELTLGGDATAAVRAYLEDAQGRPVTNQGLPLEVRVALSGGTGELGGDRLVIPPGADRSENAVTLRAGDRTGTLRLTGTAPRGLAVTAATVAVKQAPVKPATPGTQAPGSSSGGSATGEAQLVALPQVATAQAGDEVRVRIEARDRQGKLITDGQYAFQVAIRVDGQPYSGDPDRLQVTVGGYSPVDGKATPAFRDAEGTVVARTVNGVADLYVRYLGTGLLEIEPLGRSRQSKAYDDTGLAGPADSATGLKGVAGRIRFNPGPPADLRITLDPNLGAPDVAALKAAVGRTATLKVAVVDRYGNPVTDSVSVTVARSGTSGVTELLNAQGKGVSSLSLSLRGTEGTAVIRVTSDQPGTDTYTVTGSSQGTSLNTFFTVHTVTGTPPVPDIESVRGNVTQTEGIVTALDTGVAVVLAPKPQATGPVKVLFYVDGQRVGEDGPVYLNSSDEKSRTATLPVEKIGKAGTRKIQVRLDNGAEVSPLSGAVQVVYDLSGPKAAIAGVHIDWSAGELVIRGQFETAKGTAVRPERLTIAMGDATRRLDRNTPYRVTGSEIRLTLRLADRQALEDYLNTLPEALQPGGDAVEIALSGEKGWFVDHRQLEAGGFTGFRVTPAAVLTKARYSPGNQTLVLEGLGLDTIARVDPRKITLVDGSGRRYTLTTPATTVQTGGALLRIVLSKADATVLQDPARLAHVGIRLEAAPGWGEDAAGFRTPAAPGVDVIRFEGFEAAYYDARTGQVFLRLSPGFLDPEGRVDPRRLAIQDADGSPRYTLTGLAGEPLWVGDTLILTLTPADRDRINNSGQFPAAQAVLRADFGWYVGPNGREAPGTAGVPLQPWPQVTQATFHPATESLVIRGARLGAGTLDLSRLHLGGQALKEATVLAQTDGEIALRLPPAVVEALQGATGLKLEAEVGWLTLDGRYEHRGFSLSSVKKSSLPAPELTAAEVDWPGGQLILIGTGLPTRVADWDLSKIQLEAGTTELSLAQATIASLSATQVRIALTPELKDALKDPGRLGTPPVTLRAQDGWVRSLDAGVAPEKSLPLQPLARVEGAHYDPDTGILILYGTGLGGGVRLSGAHLVVTDDQGGYVRLAGLPAATPAAGPQGEEALQVTLTPDQRSALDRLAPEAEWQLLLEAGWLYTDRGGKAPPVADGVPIERL